MHFLLIILIRFGKGHSPKKEQWKMMEWIVGRLLSSHMKLLQFLFKMKGKNKQIFITFLNEMKMLLVFDSFWMMYWHLHSALMQSMYAHDKRVTCRQTGSLLQMSSILMMVTLDYQTTAVGNIHPCPFNSSSLSPSALEVLPLNPSFYSKWLPTTDN